MTTQISTDFLLGTYKDISVDFFSLPRTSQEAFVSRAMQRIYGSEPQAKVSNWKKAKDEAKEAYTDEDLAKVFRDAQDAVHKAVLEGTIGVRAPRSEPVDPLEKEMHKIAKTRILAALRSNKIKVPTGDEVIKFDSGETFTMEQLLDRQLENHGETIKREAEKALKARAKAAAEAKAKGDAAKADGGKVSAEALGL